MAKAIRIIDSEAVELINARAEAEHRPAANAASATIIEGLRDRYGKPSQHTPGGRAWQDKVVEKNIPGDPPEAA